MQDTPYFELPYPWIFGTDVAGTVARLGSNVTRFKIGQRVIGYVPVKQKLDRDGYLANASQSL